jgi:nitroimidazol reductase NimA-like FMN-containing flavoprotein (pyridoxamine 5'-phosphate oxidase superfamily)
VEVGDKIYFHGAIHGEKYEVFRANQKVTFCIDLPYAQLPSTWREGGHACTGNQFFKSVLIRGRGAIVEDINEKASSLQAMMEKHEPEGGYKPVRADDPSYVKRLTGVAMFRIDFDQIDVRLAVGGDYKPELKSLLLGKLKERGLPIDLETIVELEKSSDQPPDNQESK